MPPSFVFSAVAVDEFFTRPGIVLIDFEDLLEDIDRRIPFFIVLIPRVQFLHENGAPLFADRLCDLSFGEHKKIDFFGDELDEARPRLFYRVHVFGGDVAEVRFFIVVDRRFRVVCRFGVFGEQFCQIRFFKIELYDLFVEFPHFIA